MQDKEIVAIGIGRTLDIAYCAHNYCIAVVCCIVAHTQEKANAPAISRKARIAATKENFLKPILPAKR